MKLNENSDPDHVNEPTRRDSFRYASIGLAAAFLGATEGCDHGSISQHRQRHTFFNDEMVINRVEFTKDVLGEEVSHADLFKVGVSRPGSYVIEGWVENYRGHDTRAERWEFTAADTPFSKTLTTSDRIYRLEITRACENKGIEHETLNLSHEASY